MTPKPLRVATDRSCWREELPLAPMLRPLMGEAGARAGATSWDRRFERYDEKASSLFELSAVDDADVVVLPGDWYWVRGTSWSSRPDRELARGVRPLYERAHEAGKPVWLFFSGDRSCDRVPLAGAEVFREGTYRSRMGEGDRPLPAFPEDLVDAFCAGQLHTRTWKGKATVGFCGLARSKPAWRRAVGRVAHHAVVGARERWVEPSPYLGEELRHEAIAVLSRERALQTNFVLRDRKVFFRDADSRDLVDVRREYVHNMIDSDYVLCVRGSGNYSYRLYETLCMGRVPVIVDTDLALPCASEVDWTGLSVWVDETDLELLPERIHDFHSRMSPAEFLDLQHVLRRTWLEFLSPAGFFERVNKSAPRAER